MRIRRNSSLSRSGSQSIYSNTSCADTCTSLEDPYFKPQFTQPVKLVHAGHASTDNDRIEIQIVRCWPRLACLGHRCHCRLLPMIEVEGLPNETPVALGNISEQ